MTPSEILRKHEDANEMHFHEVDRKWIIEAMEEYAKEKSEKPINLDPSCAVTRLEIIDKQGRVYSQWNCTIELSYQDDGKTLKIFVNN